MVAHSAAKRAAIYVRVSTPGQEQDGTSLATQEEACRAYAAQHGYEVVAVYREVYSGVELWDRPRLGELREAIRGDRTDVLIAYAIDRLSRDPTHLGVILSEADYHGTAVAFVSEPLDSSPEGELIRFVRGYSAKVEHAKFSERSQRGIGARIKAGKPLPGARVLYGYRWNAARTAYVEDPLNGAVVRRIYAEALAGRTLRAIARGLTDDGIPTPTGKPAWVYTVVKKILENPRYAGEGVALRYRSTKVAGHTPSGRQRRLVRLRPENERIPLPEGTIPPLVDATVFAAAAERMRLNAQRSARNNREPEAYLLRGGYVRCGYCGRAMSAVKLANGQRIYRCAAASETRCYHGISTALLDEAVWRRVERVLLKPEVIRAEVERAAAEDGTEERLAADLAAVDRELADVDRKLANLTRRMAGEDDDVVAAAIRAELGALAERRRALAADREAALNHHAARLAARERLQHLEDWCRAVAARLAGFDYAKKRLALDALGVTVTVWRADHDPRYEITAGIPLEGEIVSPTPARSAR